MSSHPNPSRIVILAPMTVEAAPLRRLVRGRVPVIVAGVGPAAAVRSTRRALWEHRPDLVLVAGVAGGISRQLAVGDVVVPETVVDGATGRCYVPQPLDSTTPQGTIVTVDAILDDATLTSRFPDTTAVDMESAAVASVCEDANVAWSVVRGISDLTWTDPLPEATLTFLREDGRMRAGVVLGHVIRHPGDAARVWRMGQDTAAAMRGVVRVVEASGLLD